MLASLTPWKPSDDVPMSKNSDTEIWEMETYEQASKISSYIV